MKYSISQIANIVGGTTIGHDNMVTSTIFDSRDTNHDSSSMFIAIKGNRDGHNYIKPLIKDGVISFLIEKEFIQQALSLHSQNPKLGFVVGDNSVKALQHLAAHHRLTLRMPIIAITGSNGKTITKEWIAQLLPHKTIFRSPKSFNSQIGVPISILKIQGNEDLAIVEVGISKPNEMQSLQKIVAPDVVLLTNINSAHDENFETREDKLYEKLKLGKEAKILIVNQNNKNVFDTINRVYRNRIFSWGKNHCDIKCERDGKHVKLHYCGTNYTFDTPFSDNGSYENIINSLATAVAIGEDLGKAINNIPNIETIEMRMELVNGINNCRIINDTYINDIDSLAIALNYMNSISTSQKKVVILSDFATNSTQIYEDAKSLLSKYDIDTLLSVGEKMAQLKDLPFNHISFDNTSALSNYISKNSISNSTILIKGGRSYSFERITLLLQEKMHNTVLDIDLGALIDNFKYLKSLLKPTTKSVAMVKAMSYGCGTYEVSSALCNAGVDYLAVAYIDEGATLRAKGITKPIIILNASIKDFEQIVKNRLEPEIYSLKQLKLFIEYLKTINLKNYPIHVKIDSGMNRLGFKNGYIEELCQFIKENNNQEYITIDTIFSHLSSADDPALDSETRNQIAIFDKLSTTIIQTLSLKNTIRHICNSNGIMRFPEAQFDMVRMGISLYGFDDSHNTTGVSSLKSSIIQVKDVELGQTVGYNKKGTITRPTKIAIVSIGYADGFNRKLSNGNWSVKIGNHIAPTIGNISMDNCAIDITGIEANEGDEVVIFNSAEDVIKMADVVGTIPYEIMTSISSRIKRRYFK